MSARRGSPDPADTPAEGLHNPMRYLRSPNTTFDFFILPNVPPAAPDISSTGYLHSWFFPGKQVNKGVTSRFFDSALDVLLTDEERDPWPAAPGAYRIYIPSAANPAQPNQGYNVVFIAETGASLTMSGTAAPSIKISGAGGLRMSGSAARGESFLPSTSLAPHP